MIQTAIDRLTYMCETIPSKLSNLVEAEFSVKPRPDKWSKKEILGHLIDSAANNHHRFVRSQFENYPMIPYAQNEWVRHNFYQEIDSRQLIALWTSYNKHLLEIIRRIPAEYLENKLAAPDGTVYSLGFLISDYVEHLEYHMKQILRMENEQ